MEVRIAAVADYAALTLDRKLLIMGIFSTIYALKEPIVHPSMFLVYQIDFEASEIGRKDLTVVLMDDDGHELIKFIGNVDVGRPAAGQMASYNQVFALNVLSLPKFGQYEFQILLNGRTEARVPLYVVKAESPPQPG